MKQSLVNNYNPINYKSEKTGIFYFYDLQQGEWKKITNIFNEIFI